MYGLPLPAAYCRVIILCHMHFSLRRRTAAAAGEVITDAELRSRSAQLLSEAARKAGAGVAKGEFIFMLECKLWLPQLLAEPKSGGLPAKTCQATRVQTLLRCPFLHACPAVRRPGGPTAFPSCCRHPATCCCPTCRPAAGRWAHCGRATHGARHPPQASAGAGLFHVGKQPAHEIATMCAVQWLNVPALSSSSHPSTSHLPCSA